MRPHRLLQKALSRRLEGVGAHVDEERYVPELYDTVWDSKKRCRVPRLAIMDIYIQFPGAPAPYMVDVSIRSAAAERQARAAVAAPGWAAAQGEKEKLGRYGQAVRPCVFEALGRAGCAARCLLADLVATAASCGLSSPHAAQSWQTTCERAVVWGTADNMLRSMGSQCPESWCV